jgi:hypothetical protein
MFSLSMVSNDETAIEQPCLQENKLTAQFLPQLGLDNSLKGIEDIVVENSIKA